jgi:hypothetical protein
MNEREIRAALERHWAASDADDSNAEHAVHRDDAVLEYPQSGESIRGRRNHTNHARPAAEQETLRGARITGRGALGVSEYLLSYDGQPSHTVSILEFSGGRVARETQYFADPFEAGPGRRQWVEMMERQLGE